MKGPLGHPRLFLRASDLPALRRKVRRPGIAPLWRRLLADCDADLRSSPAVPPAVPSNRNSRAGSEMHIAGTGTRRMIRLAFAHLLTGRRDFAERAWREMEALMEAWKSWEDPFHAASGYGFDLMVGETGRAFGIAYDWLYHFLGGRRRDSIKAALEERVLDLYLRETAPGRKNVWWFGRGPLNNWNGVCNGGVIVAALALLGEYGGAPEVIRRALRSLGSYLATFGTEGGSEEGVGYWCYGMMYTVPALAALDCCRLPTGGLLRHSALRRTGRFPVDFQPGGVVVGWGDVRMGSRAGHPILYWLGRRYGTPELAAWQDAFERTHGTGDTFSILWRPAGLFRFPGGGSRRVRGRHYREIGWSVFADSWDAPRLVAGFKCGDLGVAHTHLDNNSFAIWTGGSQVAHDLGPPPHKNYASRYFSESRWGWYVVKTGGHNALLIDGKGQLTRTVGRLAPLPAARGGAGAVGDASRCYGPGVLRARRHFVIAADRSAIVTLDEVVTRRPSAIEWRLHSPGRVRLGESRAAVSAGRSALHVLFPGASLRLRAIADPPGFVPGETVDVPHDRVLCAATAARSRVHLLPVVMVPGRRPSAVACHAGRDAVAVAVGTGRRRREFRWRRGPGGWRFAGIH